MKIPITITHQLVTMRRDTELNQTALTVVWIFIYISITPSNNSRGWNKSFWRAECSMSRNANSEGRKQKMVVEHHDGIPQLVSAHYFGGF